MEINKNQRNSKHLQPIQVLYYITVPDAGIVLRMPIVEQEQCVILTLHLVPDGTNDRLMSF